MDVVYRLIKRTTIEFDESVLQQLKEACAARGETLSQYVQDAAIERMNRVETGKPKFKLRTYPGGKLQPGVDLNNNAALQAILDEGIPLDQLR